MGNRYDRTFIMRDVDWYEGKCAPSEYISVFKKPMLEEPFRYDYPKYKIRPITGGTFTVYSADEACEIFNLSKEALPKEGQSITTGSLVGAIEVTFLGDYDLYRKDMDAYVAQLDELRKLFKKDLVAKYLSDCSEYTVKAVFDMCSSCSTDTPKDYIDNNFVEWAKFAHRIEKQAD